MQFFRRIPATVYAIGSLVGIALIIFRQPLFSGEIVNATDIITQSFFWNVFLKENFLTDLSFQTWLPYINAGTPFMGPLDALFRPINFLTLLLLPLETGLNIEMIVYFVSSAIGMYFYMRELRVSALSAFLSALFFMLNGEIVTLMNAGHVNKIGAIFPTPFVFLAFERALRLRTCAAFLLAGTALGFQFWHGHVQVSFYLCLAIGVYYVVRASIMFVQERDCRQIARLTAYALVMVIVFLALAAVHFLPMLTFAQVSERADGVSYEFATSWSLPPEEIVTYLIPGFFGLRRLNVDDDEPQLVEYWGRAPFMQTGRYFGLLPVLLAVMAVCFVRQKHILTLSLIAAFALWLAMGQYIPTYKLLYDYGPGFNKFRVPQMILYLFAFATSALAGFGAEWLFAPVSVVKDSQLRRFLAVGFMFCLLAWIVTFLWPQLQPTLLTFFHDAWFRKDAPPEIAAARYQNVFRGLLQMNLFLGLTLVGLGLRVFQAARRWLAVIVLVGIYLVDIALVTEKYIDTIPLKDSVYINVNDAIRYTKNDPDLFRIFPALNQPSTYAVANKYLYHHLYSIAGYEAVGVAYYNRFLEQMQFGSALLDLLNIKYIVLPKDVEIDGQRPYLGQMIGPYKVVLDADAVLVENLHYLPRFFPVHVAQVFTTPEEIFGVLTHPDFQPRELVILEQQLPPAQARLLDSNTGRSAAASSVRLTSYANRRVALQVNMAEHGLLVWSEKYYTGWHAHVDGQRTPIYKADYTLQAVFVPQGTHEVVFTYQPRQYFVGLSITALTGLLLAGFAIAQRCRRKKSLLS